MIIKYVFSIHNGRYLSVAIPWENYPIPNRHGFRMPTENVYPCYDINNKYMGYMDNGKFHDMREGWYCTICNFDTMFLLDAVIHDIRHLPCIRKRKTEKVNYIYEYSDYDEKWQQFYIVLETILKRIK